MDILTIVLVNLALVSLLVGQAFAGRNRGFKYQLVRLIITICIGVGCFFLAPVVAKGIMANEVFAAWIESGSATHIGSVVAGSIGTITFAVLFALAYGISEIACIITIAIDKKRKRNKINAEKDSYIKVAKTVAVRDRNTVVDRVRERADRRAARREFARAHRKSRVFGCILGVLEGLLICFILILPVARINVINKAAEPKCEVCATYNYTGYGYIETLTKSNVTQTLTDYLEK